MIERPNISVLICTFNQEDYIEQAVRSALAQRTSLNFEILVGDDNSTDKTISILKIIQEEFPEKVFIHSSAQNEGATRNLLRLISLAKGDYIAILDGDDYWNDPDKLQKQWDVITNDSSIGMVCSYASKWDQANSKMIGLLGSDDVESFERLISGDSDVAAPTIFMKKDFLKECVAQSQWYIDNNMFFDSVISYWFAFYSRIHFIPESLAVYRVLPNSSCHSTDERVSQLYQKRYFSIKLRFLIENPVSHDFAHAILMNEWEKIKKFSGWSVETRIRASKVHRLGNLILKPFRLILRRRD